MKRVPGSEMREKELVREMISIYCRGNHGCSGELCPDCEKLLGYAETRIDRCRFKETKSFCSRCKNKCYSEQMQIEIRKVMRYSGPRMLFIHPILVIRHAITSREG